MSGGRLQVRGRGNSGLQYSSQPLLHARPTPNLLTPSLDHLLCQEHQVSEGGVQHQGRDGWVPLPVQQSGGSPHAPAPQSDRGRPPLRPQMFYDALREDSLLSNDECKSLNLHIHVVADRQADRQAVLYSPVSHPFQTLLATRILPHSYPSQRSRK